MSLDEALAKRRSVRSFQDRPVTLEQESQLLWAAQGITDPATGHRTAPSAMAKYPLTVWMFTNSGVYRYVPNGHKFVQVLAQDHRAGRDAAGARRVGRPLRLASSLPATQASSRAATSPAMADPFVYLEAGHAAENLALEATALGLATVTQGGINAAAISKLLSLPEGTLVVYTMPVGYPFGK